MGWYIVLVEMPLIRFEELWPLSKESHDWVEKIIVVMLTKDRHGERKKVGFQVTVNIQVNVVKQQLVDRRLRVQWCSDYQSTTQMVSHVIVSR